MVTGREQGFLLLTSTLGIPGRKVLTAAQLRTLGNRVQAANWADSDRDLNVDDLLDLGYSREMARRILVLLEDGQLLDYYCRQCKKWDCYPISRVSDAYPQRLYRALGMESPGCLWYKGDPSILQMPAISLVGSRDLAPDNQRFAREIGRQAALQGYALVSGNARGADREAQNACLQSGGKVISVVADTLAQHRQQENILYISEDDFDAEFSAARALSRNRVIHALGEKTFVAQCGYQTGGTWDGTVKNLNHGWSSVVCFRDWSEAMLELEQMGAWLLEISDLEDFGALRETTESLFDR
jgi:DNA processing protein